MTAGAHDAVTLGCYALGVLDAHESLGVEQHLRGCPSCRAQVADFHRIRKVLDEIPREAFLHELELEADLPKPSDLVLQRTLRQIRNESVVPQPRVAEPRPRASPRAVEEPLPEPQHAKSRRWPGYLAAAAVAAVVAFGAGAVVMQNQAPGTSVASTRSGEGTSGGIKLVAKIAPSSQDRYLVSAQVAGLPAAQKCKLIVVGTDGTKAEAFVWTTSDKPMANVQGMVSVSPDKVKSIAVENAEGKSFVVANL
jgi:hypothetical protein